MMLEQDQILDVAGEIVYLLPNAYKIPGISFSLFLHLLALTVQNNFQLDKDILLPRL
jgi:hypothetical protein